MIKPNALVFVLRTPLPSLELDPPKGGCVVDGFGPWAQVTAMRKKKRVAENDLDNALDI